MNKNEARRDRFNRIRQECPNFKRQGDPDVNDYHTGRASKFEPHSGDSHDPALHSMPLGPQFKTPQWIRTTR